MTPTQRKKVYRANAAKARAALAAKRAQDATGKTVREIPLSAIPAFPAARTPAAGALTTDREIQALAQLVVAVFEEYRRRNRVK